MIEALLSTEPLDVLLAQIPAIGEWADTRLLPQILPRDRVHALPTSAAQHVVTMQALSKPGEEYAGVYVVHELCDPGLARAVRLGAAPGLGGAGLAAQRTGPLT